MRNRQSADTNENASQSGNAAKLSYLAPGASLGIREEMHQELALLAPWSISRIPYVSPGDITSNKGIGIVCFSSDQVDLTLSMLVF